MLDRIEKAKDPELEAALEAANKHLNLPLVQSVRRRRAAAVAAASGHDGGEGGPLLLDPVSDGALTANRDDQGNSGASGSFWQSRRLFDVGAAGTVAPAPQAPMGSSGIPANMADSHAMRFHVEYQLGEAAADFDEMLQVEVMPRAMRALSRVLRIKNLQQPGNLQLPRQCVRVFTDGRCAATGPMCRGALPQEVPEYLYGEGQQCDDAGNCEALEGGGGAPDADFVVFVTARQTEDCQPTTTAHAVACVTDSEGLYGPVNRPLAGHVNFCPTAGRGGVSAGEPRSVEAVIDTAVHELVHALFMSRSLYPSFQLPEGTPRLGSESSLITTPAVVGATREQFDCDSAAGAPVELDGGSGTALSHWEETAFFTEIMVGVSSSEGRRIMSSVTLALAQDSGWYEVNFAGAGFLRHGHFAGCEMLGSCTAIPEDSRAGQNFCGSEDRCRNHDTTGWCAGSSLSPCPLLRPVAGGDCKLPGNLFARFGNAGASTQPAAIAAGVHFGPSAICLGVPGGRFSREGVASWQLSETCFASRCDDAGSSLFVLIKEANGDGFKEYPCPEGEFLVLPMEDGFDGTMELGPCPPPEEVCPYKGCPAVKGNLCDGQGWCYNGKCRCAVDRAGPACSQMLCDSTEDCPGEQYCSEMKECIGGSEPDDSDQVLEFDSSFVDFEPLTAVRVGYLQTCVFFADDNLDGRPSISLGERSQPTGPHGELSLYLPGESETLVSPVKQMFNETQCIDTLSAKRRMSLLFQAPAGLPSQKATVNVLTTAVGLLVRGGATLEQALAQVAGVFGVAEDDVAGRDWLRELVNREAEAAVWSGFADTAVAAIATILATEQVAGYVAGADATVSTRDAANTFLIQLASAPIVEDDATGQSTAVGNLRDTQWLQAVIADLPAAVRGEEAAMAPAMAPSQPRVSDNLPDNVAVVAGTDAPVAAQMGEFSGAQTGEEAQAAPVAEPEERRRSRLRRLANVGDVGDAAGGDVAAAEEDDVGSPQGPAIAGAGGGAAAGDAVVALAETLVRVTNALIVAYRGKGPEDLEEVLEAWAGIAFVADGDFVTAAAQLGLGRMNTNNYERATSTDVLRAGAEAHDVDLREATKLQEEDFLDRYREKIVDWLQQTHGGLIGWAWLGLGLTTAMLLCCTCCIMRARSKQPFVPPAVTNRLPQAVSARLPAVATRPGGLTAGGRSGMIGGKHGLDGGDSVPVYVRTAAPVDYAASVGGTLPLDGEAPAGADADGGPRHLEKAGSLMRGRRGHGEGGGAEGGPAHYVDHDELVRDLEERQAHMQGRSPGGGGGWGLRDKSAELARQLSRSLSRTGGSSPKHVYKRMDQGHLRSPRQRSPRK